MLEPTLYTHNCDAMRSNFDGIFSRLVGVVGMVSRRVPSLIKSITLVVPLLTLGATVRAPANSLHAVGCLAAPNSPAPEGSWWYYRLDWPTQRKCWYLRAPDRSLRRGTATAATPLRSTRARFGHRHSTDGLPISVDPSDTALPSSPCCFQSRHRHRRRSPGQWTNLSSKAHSKVAHRHRRRRSPHKQPRCRRLATSRLDGLSSPLLGPIPYPRVQRLRHHLSLRPQPIRLRIRAPMLQREQPAAVSWPTTPGSLW